MSIITESPLWFVPLCLIAGLVYAGALYFRDRFNRTYGWKLAALLGVLRFFVVTILAFFLLHPLVKTIDRKVEKPVVIIAQDNSESLVVGKDSAYYKHQYLAELENAIAPLRENYDVQTISFGSEVKEGLDSLRFDEQFTDYSQLLNEINNRYSGRNLGGIVIASDGIYNKGASPVNAYKKLNVPVFTVALGDTTMYKDILLSEVNVNRLAYLGNQFPVQITVEGRKAAGETSVLTVSKKGNTLFSQTILFEGDRFFKTIPVTLDANEIGLQRYTVSLSPIGNEVTEINNRKDFFIDVLDSREKILILAAAPHPDIAAMREALSGNETYKVEAKLAKDFNGNISDYNLVIFHQLPAAGGLGTGAITNALERNVPSLFVWGNATDFRAYNALNLGFALNNFRNTSTDIGGRFAEEFTLFQLEPSTEGMFDLMPPLALPFGDYSFSPGIYPLVYQQLGNLKTQKPLIAFNRVGDAGKTGLIAGEGIWRWRLTAFAQQGSHDAFNEFMIKCAQYMSAKEDKSLFRVNGEHDYLENENIIFSAELYNQSFEPIANRDIKINIRDEEGKSYDYSFSSNGTSYRLDAGRLPVGHYSYEAKTVTEQGTLTEKGEFSVSPLQLEVTNTIADHRLLNQFARENNGALVYPSQLAQLAELIRSKKEIVPVVYENKQLNDLIHFRWILALILLLLCGEWLLRKRAGTY